MHMTATLDKTWKIIARKKQTKMKEFDYYRLLLERLESQSPIEGEKEYDKMREQADLIGQGIMKWMNSEFERSEWEWGSTMVN